MGNLSLLTSREYYYSPDKMMEENGDQAGIWYEILVGVTSCVPWPTGLNLVTLFSLSVSIEDRPLLWMVVRSQTYYPKHILAYESGKTRCALVMGSGSFRTD